MSKQQACNKKDCLYKGTQTVPFILIFYKSSSRAAVGFNSRKKNSFLVAYFSFDRQRNSFSFKQHFVTRIWEQHAFNLIIYP